MTVFIPTTTAFITEVGKSVHFLFENKRAVAPPIKKENTMYIPCNHWLFPLTDTSYCSKCGDYVRFCDIIGGDVDVARKNGYLIHIEQEDEALVPRYYAASLDWVNSYYRSGGMWDYD